MERNPGGVWFLVQVGWAALPTLTRFWAGWAGRPAKRQPDRPLVLYEFEGCPFCRIAREAVSGLHLPVDIRPCPKQGTRFRPELVRLGGKAQFPYLIDPNTDTRMYESADIARFLFKTYGQRPQPLHRLIGFLDTILASLSLAFRLGAGARSRKRSVEIEQPLEMWGVEADPRARLLREALCELELPYRRHPGRGPGDGMGPAVALRDPNVGDPNAGDPDGGGTVFSGAAAALAHLKRTYG
ncbi:MAG: glutathione S-transferase N-terminal domain-containing protein [Alphaproteobacteria bacterium]